MAMTLRLTDEETELLRRLSELEGRSMQEVSREAIMSEVEKRLKLAIFLKAAEIEVPRYQEVLDRLAE
jgi:predicted transcriptional regulator